jgi:hypothetical protein
MSSQQGPIGTASSDNWLSLDTWAVIIALVLALAVRFDVFKNVPW